MPTPTSARQRPQRAGLVEHHAPALVRQAARSAPTTARLPKHSAFFAPPLEILLDHPRAERLIIAGAALRLRRAG